MTNKIYFYKNSNNFLKAKVFYNEQELSFITKPNYITDFTIMTGAAYLGLDINLSNKLVMSISGCCPKYNWIKTNLKMQENIEKGDVMIETDIDLIAGTGIELFEKLPIYYCEENNWVCIGNKHNNNDYTNIRFMENAIISLKNNEFKALWINLTHSKEVYSEK